MKKLLLTATAAVAMMATSCGSMMQSGTATGNTELGDLLGGVLGSVVNANSAQGLLDMVIGYVKIDQQALIGTWYYSGPGCAFTSENLLSKAGGTVAAANVKEKLKTAYDGIGVSSQNTQFTFTADGQFSAKIKGIPFSGTYTYDPSSGALQLKTMLVSSTAYITRTSSGLALTFESKKLVTLLQTAAALSGNSTLQTVGNMSKDIDGVRVGFEMNK